MTVETKRSDCASPLQPYSGVRILDITHHFGLYAGRLFADLGAEVILIEPPEGLADRQQGPEGDAARFAFLNASKKSVVIDENAPGARHALERLVKRFDIVLVERGGPLFDDLGWIASIQPRAVVTAISPYGMTGPMADAPASDLVFQAGGRIAWMSGRIDDTPLSLPFERATMVGSIYTATVTATALADAERTGRGHVIDVSVQECIAHSLQNAVQVWDLEQRISISGSAGTRDATEDIFPYRDGYVFLASPLALGASWGSLVAWITQVGHPSATALPQEKWSSREWRLTQEARSEFRTLFTALTMEHDKEALTVGALARCIVMGPVNRLSETFHDPQLLRRGFYRAVALPDIVLQSDVVSNNLGPGAMSRVAMDYETVRRIKPDIIYLSMPMYGEDGQRAELLGVGMTISAVSGLMWSTGYRADDPVGPGTHYPDHAANPYHAAFAVLAALRRRRLTGEGMKIDLSQVESTINFIGSAMVRCAAAGTDFPQIGDASRTMAPQGIYRCAGDDAWCAVTAVDDAHWAAFAAILGGDARSSRFASVDARLAAREETDALIGNWTADKSAEIVAETLTKAGIPAAMVANARHLIERDRQLAERAYWQRVGHPELGCSLYASPPYRIDGERVELARPPLLGEHTRAVLGDLLGMSSADLDRFEAAGVFK